MIIVAIYDRFGSTANTLSKQFTPKPRSTLNEMLPWDTENIRRLLAVNLRIPYQRLTFYDLIDVLLIHAFPTFHYQQDDRN